MKTTEANFDGLVGPTHSYAGLSYGNIASMSHRLSISNPREAVLQGLDKAKALADLGFVQGLLPPQERPDMETLRRLGFGGSDANVLESAFKVAPELLAACSSASSMWTANAATVSPSCDSKDGKVHFTAANLTDKLHRAIESETTARILKAVFRGDQHFTHHDPLPGTPSLGDEGAANHTRFCDDYGQPGLQLFIYGRVALDHDEKRPARFPARQTLEASRAIARLHQLDPERVLFAQQDPGCIDAGAFHNDVVSVGNQNVFFYHERAFLDSKKLMSDLQEQFQKLQHGPLKLITVAESEVTLNDAVKSYLFNSQLITGSDGRMILVAPDECRKNPSVVQFLSGLLQRSDSTIGEVKYFDLRQSMQNGGGPACLRLRVVLNPAERAATNPACFMNPKSYQELKRWAEGNYRDRLRAEDLADPHLLNESRSALDQLTQIMGLGSMYPFQK